MSKKDGTIEPGTKKLRLRNYLAYGAGDLYGGGAFFIVTTFSMYYLVNVVGMKPIFAGLIPAIGKIWDAISDPLMGYIADNTPKNRFGRRRVWFLISIVPIGVTFALIWFPTNISSQLGKFFFYTIMYILFFTVTTVSYVPYAALSAEITKDSKERNKLNGYRIAFAFISTLIAGLIAKPIIDGFESPKMGHFVMGIVFGLIFALPWITLYFGTWELPRVRPPKSEKHFFSNFFSLFKNRSCKIHIIMYVCSYGTLDIIMSWMLFYFVDYLEKGSIFIIAQGSLLITMLVMLPVYVKIANKKGHGVAYTIGLSIIAAGLILLSLQTSESPMILLVLNTVLLGAGISAGNLIPHQLLPFVTDVDRLITRRGRAGTYSAAMTLSRKMFLGIVIMGGLGYLLGHIEYKNPVPSILAPTHYEEAISLAKDDPEFMSMLENDYSKLEDGNYHLNYYGMYDTQNLIDKTQDVSMLASIFGKYEKMDISSFPAETFEQEILGHYDPKNFQQIGKIKYLKSQYTLVDGTYIFNGLDENGKDKMIEGAIPIDALYNLRVKFDEHKFKYTGIGEVIKPKQKTATLKKLRVLFIVLPLIMVITGIVTAQFFKLTPKTHKIIVDEYARLEAGGKKEDVDPEVKKICEKVSGFKYEDLYPEL